MNEPTHEDFTIPVSVASAHGLLFGRLALAANAIGFVVLAHDSLAKDGRNQALTRLFHGAGLSTLSVDLLSENEERFSDVHYNVPLLAKRLLDFLALVKNRMQLGELPTLPIGLWAADATAPVALRVAALRNHDIAAIVCRGGLIDLAGMLYLRSLDSPLLVLVDENDAQHIASNTRALQEIGCTKELKLIATAGADGGSTADLEEATRDAADWFVEHFKTRASTVAAP